MAELKRTLGFWMTSAFTFLNLINTGIFFAVAIAVKTAGWGTAAALLALGLMSVYTAMCFSELITMFPSAGGVYEFAKRAYGSFISFEVGWVIWLINNIATALLVVAAVEYLFPEGALAGLPVSPTVFKLALVILAILLMNYVAFRGAEDSARLMLTLAVFTVLLFAVIIVPGALQVHLASIHFADVRWTSVLVAAFLLSETFFGWESVSFMAEEIKDPSRTVPRALIGTTMFAVAVSIAVAVITISVLGVQHLASEELARPIIAVLQELGFSNWLILAANLGIVASFVGNAAGGIIGNPRLLMALSRDKLFIEQFSEIHPKYQTPYRGIVIQTVVAILIALLAAGAYQRLLELLVAPSIVLYVLMIALIPLFRWTRPDHPRPYRAPLGRVVPFVVVGFYLAMLVVWVLNDPGALVQLRVLASFMLFSAPIYLLLTYFYNPDALIGTLSRFAFVSLWLENVLVPKRLRREVIGLVPEAKGRLVVELGAGVGSLTKPLASHVGKTGRVYAIDFSEGNVRILRRRMENLGHTHVRVIHDPHLINRIHPDIKNADVVVSIGALSYIQDVRKVLGEVYLLLSERGRVCFVEYVDLFWFLPNNPKWLSRPDEVRRIFAEAGFSVSVTVRRGLFWKYLIVHGFKERSGAPYI